MAATLDRNGKDGKKPVMDSGVPSRERIRCARAECEISYTLAYTDSENYLYGSEKNVDLMQRMATELANNDHPAHSTKTYLWKGPERGWLEADSMAARSAL